MDYLLRGILIGLFFGLPVGDCFYAAVGVFGITLISDFLLKYQVIINIFGGGLILYMGIRLLIKKEEVAPKNGKTTGTLKMFLSSFAVGITNPAAILTFLFAFSYFGISAGTVFAGGVAGVGEIDGHSALTKAYEMRKAV